MEVVKSPQKLSEVARKIGVSRQAVYKILKSLEQKEVIVLEPDTERRNSKVIVITPKGEQFILEAVGILHGIEEDLCELIGSESVKKLREVLQKDWKE